MASKSRVRELAIQICYQHWFTDYSLERVFELFWRNMDDDRTTKRLTEELVGDVVDTADQLDMEITAYLKNWTLDRVVILDRIILRIAFHEFMERTDVPPKVVIDQALQNARAFTSEKSVIFINGVLHAWAVKNRDMEASPRKPKRPVQAAKADLDGEEAAPAQADPPNVPAAESEPSAQAD